MTRRERAIAFILGVVLCSLLSCGLSLIASENDVILSGGHPTTTHLTKESVPIHNQTSARATTSHGSVLWAWDGGRRNEMQQNNHTMQEHSEGELRKKAHGIDEMSSRSPSLWQSLRERVSPHTNKIQLPHKATGDFLSGWFANIYGVLPFARRVSWAGLNGFSAENTTWSHSALHNHTGDEAESNSVAQPHQEIDKTRIRASDGLVTGKQRLKAGAGVTVVLAGVMGIVACALIATGAIKLLRNGRDDDEGAVRRTVFEDRRKNEEVVDERIVRDAIDEIVPEEAV